MTDRYDTLTVTFDEPIREDDLEVWINAIQLMDKVGGVEAGRVDNLELLTAKRQLRTEAFEAWDEVFDF